MTTEIVIARYNENLDWIKLLDKNIKITIYNKGEPIDYPSIKLPNIGRESHTYLYHIINNYNKLADKTNINIIITLENNKLIVTCNKVICINYKLDKKYNNLNNAIMYDIADYNNYSSNI